jgi:cysteinyl-tRNA synthetase
MAMDDDFNTADAVSVIFELAREVNTAVSPRKDPASALAGACLAIFDELCGVLGIPCGEEKADSDAELEKAIAARQAARKAKNWAQADRIRDEFKGKGHCPGRHPPGRQVAQSLAVSSLLWARIE